MIFFNPIYKDKIWGGSALARCLGRKLAPGSTVGESWELSGFGSDISVATTPPYAGRTLDQIVAAGKGQITGSRIKAGPFPLLYKFIDANDKLSIQVHPDDEQAISNKWGAYGKTECWYVVDARPGADIIVGLNRASTTAEIREAVKANRIEGLLNRFPIAKGDVLFIPAGTIHAILDGTVIYEIQETSDTTFRLYDWGRTDEKGRPRDLHLEESLQVLDTTAHDRHKIQPLALPSSGGVSRQFRAACRYFALEEYHLTGGASLEIPLNDSFRVITVLEGSVNSGGTGQIPVGATVLMPASREVLKLRAHDSCRFLLSYVPDLAADVIAPLARAGYTREKIELLGGNPLRNDLLPLLTS